MSTTTQKPSAHPAAQAFARLIEGLINEASTTMSTMRDLPGGQELFRLLHQRHGLSHDMEYTETSQQGRPIYWKNLRDAANGAWVIIHGPRGVGAIRREPGSDDYLVMTSTRDGMETRRDSMGGRIAEFIKQNIGGLQRYFVAIDPGTVARKRELRRQRQVPTPVATRRFDMQDLERRFRPLLVQNIDMAMADIKGHAGNQLKNDAFDKAQQRIQRLARLSELRDLLMTPGQLNTRDHSVVSAALTAAIANAVHLAAAHLYPDLCGDMRREASGYHTNQVRRITATDRTGYNRIMSELAQGNIQRLVMIMHFFRNEMVKL